MRETFTPKRFSPDHQAIIDQADAICRDYQEQGLTVTLRQLYYQFVAKALIPNTQQSYKRLGSIINDARMAGALDWSYMEDRGRNVRGGFGGYRDPGHYLGHVANGYVEPLWADQQYRPEVWVEKEALISIIEQAAGAYRVPRFACKGYVSQSEMYAAAGRMRDRLAQGLTPVVIHLGDHDPSGVDMTRDIHDRLSLMAGEEIEVVRIALTMQQIEELNPPPNPAKITDSRAVDYIREHGRESWELDALEPTYLRDLIQGTIARYVDQDLFAAAEEREQENEDRIRTITERWSDLDERWDEILDLIGDED
jgi:hypothetical protein